MRATRRGSRGWSAARRVSVDAQFRAAHARLAAGDFAAAERGYRALTAASPLFAWHNLGVLHMKLGRDAEAEAAFRTALKADPQSAPTRHSLGMLLLRLGRYAEGWPEFEARRRNMAIQLTRPNLPYPEWRGEDLAGKHLVVVREQGFGDQIMFARFIPELVRRAARVTYVCSPNLVRLFEGLGAELIPASEAPPPSAADFWVADCSLGLRLDVTLENLPAAPYLAAAGNGGGGVGLAWKASATGFNAGHKVLPDAFAARLLDLGARSLQPEDTGAKDFAETAALIAGLDRVIAIDTAVAHLAAALGKPTWILLPALDVDWRWLADRTDSPWYPSARLFRQAPMGDWAAVIDQVVAAL